MIRSYGFRVHWSFFRIRKNWKINLKMKNSQKTATFSKDMKDTVQNWDQINLIMVLFSFGDHNFYISNYISIFTNNNQ